MIIILTDNSDQTTNDVIGWLKQKKETLIRINIEDFLNYSSSLIISNSTIEYKLKTKQSNILQFKNLNLEQKSKIKIWFRRWGDTKLLNISCQTESLNYQISEFLQSQLDEYKLVFFNQINKSNWLNHLENMNLKKIDVLQKAASVGLKIPNTLITNKKADVLNFLKINPIIITKTIGDTQFFIENDKTYGLYTSLITKEDLQQMPINFFPTMFQEYIDKVYELRIFFLNKTFYSMAIFSQNNDKTKVDFRQYDNDFPNRNVPYIIPLNLQKKLLMLCKDLNLNCCSFDFIKSKQHDYIFLEVNPVGQFGMVSYPCNYYLEEKIANYLTKNKK